mgnify:FL=1|jgi:hypothetical protein|tara:strand:+ start:39 stop:458 length:420 start_codon:yes stop_codon:yes gene_type:complete
MFSIISGIMSSKQEVANATNTIHCFGGNRIVEENTNVKQEFKPVVQEFSKPVVQKFKPEKTNTIRAFGMNRIVEENASVKQEFSKPIINEYSGETEIRKRNVNSGPTPPIFAFGCNYIVNSNPNSSHIKTSMFGFPFVK